MSTLWTPGGEVPVDDGRGGSATSPQQGPQDQVDDQLAGLSDEERAQAEELAQQLAEAREQIANTPASVVVGNHAMGLYELGAIHLSQQPPNLEESRLAIDALGTLVEGMEGRLGEHEATLKEALHQIRMAFVQVSRTMEGTAEEDAEE
ncbi:DUF1844 domain-containing protein [Candidatus Poriferisocius sp.]|uniref:DUF1844 domain-containing protein n=1 Tax=Candidatus Poriferisocius sp. TaxID=3101276 RepID=UPI003B52694C